MSGCSISTQVSGTASFQSNLVKTNPTAPTKRLAFFLSTTKKPKTSEMFLLEVVQKGNLSACQKLVSKCGKVAITAVSDKNESMGQTALNVAARWDQLEILLWFLQQKINCDAVDGDGLTALMVAASSGHLRIVRALALAGANTGLKSWEGMTPCELAQLYGHTEVAEFLAERERLHAGLHIKPAAHDQVPQASTTEAVQQDEGKRLVLDDAAQTVEEPAREVEPVNPSSAFDERTEASSTFSTEASLSSSVEEQPQQVQLTMDLSLTNLDLGLPE
eukprot:m.515756 g.515756  ORF g.515756 m.515756 type:complete len:276 (-) comp57463_c0_seq43:2496-3323(-)